jgi:hypothetical protein
LGVPVMIGVGGTVDFLSGRIKRAPLWMQHGGLEWLFRLGQEPRRLARRYARDLWEFVLAAGRPMVAAPTVVPPQFGSDRAWLVLLDEKWQSIEMPDVLDSTAVIRNAAFGPGHWPGFDYRSSRSSVHRQHRSRASFVA